MQEEKFIISTGKSRLDTQWKRKNVTWEKFAERCARTDRTSETVAEYKAMSKDQRARIKDVGGFVAGSINGGRRKKESVTSRSMLTLDLDYIEGSAAELWETVAQRLPFAALVYSSHTHTPEAPRLRLIVPTSREMRPNEYEAVARRVADKVGINQFDDTTYEAERLMYWPSTAKDGEFFYKIQAGDLCDPDAILKEYDDWKNVEQWPRSHREKDIVRREIKKVGDPREKREGDSKIIGAFCRAYSIEDAIETFLPDIYKPGTRGRYSYAKGESTNGVVCYDHLFSYSHHETDPASRQLCNAFDLCRIHLYGPQDIGTRVQDPARLPSFKAMREFAAADKRVKMELVGSAGADFAGIDADSADTSAAAKTGSKATDWRADLEFTKKNDLKPTVKNFRLILENDEDLKGRFYVNELSNYIEAGRLPWRGPGQWQDADDANLRGYIEEHYQLTGKDKLLDAFTIVALKNKRHPVREYLGALTWDGVKRLDTVIIKYLGAKDTELTRLITRKHFVAAVARVMDPGVKYDTCLTLTGPEETGKSSLFRILGGAWFDDSITTIEGKEGRESLRGKWIIELAELNSIKRSEIASVKNFLSNQADSYRAAYDRRVAKYPRQCVFCGTTNEDKFLKGDTGNRRFWIIQIQPELCKGRSLKSRLADLENLRGQLWAEAFQLYRNGETLWLDDEQGRALKKMQENYSEESEDPIKNLLPAFLDMKTPTDWPAYSLQRRRAWINNPDPLDAEGTVTRDRFSVIEFLCECLGMNKGDKEYKYMALKVGRIMATIPGWEKMPTTSKHAKIYGPQKYYKRTGIAQPDDEDDL